MKEKKSQPTPDAVAKLFERFALGGYKSTAFSEALYRAMSHAFGFIAHFDRAGFYAARFADLDVRVETLTVMSQKDEWFSDGPEEVAIRAVVEKHDLLVDAVRERDALVERAERAELARLLGKYGPPIEAPITGVPEAVAARVRGAGGGRTAVDVDLPYTGGASIEVGAPLPKQP